MNRPLHLCLLAALCACDPAATPQGIPVPADTPDAPAAETETETPWVTTASGRANRCW